MSLMQIAKWNYLRNNLEYNAELEEAMVLEEEAEFKDALGAYINLENDPRLPLFKEEAVVDTVVDMIDAYCDVAFVYYGTCLKGLGQVPIKQRQSLSVIHTLLTEILITHGVNMFEHGKPPFIDVCMRFVIEANEAKPITKTKSKVAKGSEWVDPKEKIKEYLLAEGFQADTQKAIESLKEQIKNSVKPKVVNINDLPNNEGE